MADQPQIIQFEGATHVFPADFTPEEISTALRQAHPRPGPVVPGTERTGLPGIATPSNVLRQRARELDAAEQTLKQAFAPDTRGFGESALDQITGLNPIPALKQWWSGPKTIATLPTPEGRITDIPVAAPVATATAQAVQGNVPGAAGTLLAGVPTQAALAALGTEEGRQAAAKLPGAVARLPGDVVLKIPPKAAGAATVLAGGALGLEGGGPLGAAGTLLLGKQMGLGRLGEAAWTRVQNAIREGRAAEAKAALDRLTAEYNARTAAQMQADYAAEQARRAQADGQPAPPAGPPPAEPEQAPASQGAPTPDYEAIFRQQQSASSAGPSAETATAAPAETRTSAEIRSLNDAASYVTEGKVKEFDKLTNTTQQELARKIAAADIAKQARAAAPVPPETPAAGPQEPASAPEAAPAAQTPATTVSPVSAEVAELSRRINEEQARAAAEQAPRVEEIITGKRGTRAAQAVQFADYLRQKGLSADAVARMTDREQLLPFARDLGIDIVKDKTAFGKLRDAIADEMRSRAAAKSQGAPAAEEPRPITKGGEALQPFTMARELAAQGVNSAKAAKFPNERWQQLGVQPNQVGPVMRALQAQERLGMVAQ